MGGYTGCGHCTRLMSSFPTLHLRFIRGYSGGIHTDTKHPYLWTVIFQKWPGPQPSILLILRERSWSKRKCCTSENAKAGFWSQPHQLVSHLQTISECQAHKKKFANDSMSQVSSSFVEYPTVFISSWMRRKCVVNVCLIVRFERVTTADMY